VLCCAGWGQIIDFVAPSVKVSGEPEPDRAGSLAVGIGRHAQNNIIYINQL
jgi:hypothetical protein